MKKFKRVVQLELNEISRDVIDQLIARNECPNFKEINTKWSYFETASESEYKHLEPWIQWVTAHTGKTYAEHEIFHLGDATNLKQKQIWEALSEQGIESAIIGSMNTIRGAHTSGGMFFPDPWSKEGKAYPNSLQPL